MSIRHALQTCFILILLSAYVLVPFAYAKTSCDNVGDLSRYDDEELEDLYNACNAEIEAEKKRLEEKKQETASISRDVSILSSNIAKSNAFINARSIEIKKIQSSISKQKEKVQEVETQAERAQASIADLIRRKNELDTYSVVEAVFSEGSLSDFFADINDFDVIRGRLEAQFAAFNHLKDTIIEEQAELAEEESRQRGLAQEKQQETEKIKYQKAEQQVLLQISKEKEAEYAQVIKQKEAIKAQLRARLFTVASGEKVSFGEAYDVIKPYQKSLGIDPAFILAVLFQESGWGGEIGGNIGQCTYNQYNAHGGSKNGTQVMSASQQSNFERLMADLGRDPASQAVSCPIPTDGAYGGAMGPAQFMPNTWMDVRGQAAGYLGKPAENMSPFNNQDAFIASGTYLRNHYYSSSCTQYAQDYAHIRSKNELREKCAAARYYAGGNWWNYRNTYGESVLNRANRFRADIATLND